ncbi:MAG TPA: tRNA (adenosine(37)-N6)-threonylcarbamoyltransferase complex transferase subunit TsaD, partial [Rhodocyclaceae bacterium]|nr:tRNA (adenosine(37)-N6)-threonylcarbamoyltransferase complex transferase subunit TsaD [Rhodocyclaceae bacterium]
PSAREKANLAWEFQEAVTEVLAAKSAAVVRQYRLDRLVVAGGVGANRRLRERLDAAAAAKGFRVYYPDVELCTDNGAMIAFCGAQRLLAGQRGSEDGAFGVRPRWPLEIVT